MSSSPVSGAPPSVASREILFSRLEVKYLIDRTTRTALEQDVAALMRPDSHAGPDGTYQVRSLYFDTPDYMAYHEKIDGTSERHKLRVRAYGEDPRQTPFVRLEVKSRYLSFIHKITVDVPREDYCEIEVALKRRILPPARIMNDDRVSKEFFRLQRQYNFEPKVIVQYRRQAFQRTEMSRIRVNFDDELFSCRNLDLLGPLEGARRLLRYGDAIFEIKVDDMRMPYWLHTLIGKYNLQNEAVSKYCYCVRGQGRMSAVGRGKS